MEGMDGTEWKEGRWNGMEGKDMEWTDRIENGRNEWNGIFRRKSGDPGSGWNGMEWMDGLKMNGSHGLTRDVIMGNGDKTIGTL